MTWRVWWDMQLMLVQRTNRRKEVLGARWVGRGGTHFANVWWTAKLAWLLYCQFTAGGKPGPPGSCWAWGVQELDSADLSLSVAAH